MSAPARKESAGGRPLEEAFAEAFAEVLRRELEPLRLEIERLRRGNGTILVPLPEAARRLGISLRTVQQRAKDGRLQVEIVAGERMARLPASLDEK